MATTGRDSGKSMTSTINKGEAMSLMLRLIGIVALLTLIAACMPGAASAELKRQSIYEFGPDGTANTEFNFNQSRLAFDETLNHVFEYIDAFSEAERRIFGFDASSPGVFTPLGGNFPLAPATGSGGDIAVSSATGNIYFVSPATDTLYGYNSSGTPLGGNFPVTVADATKNFCGVEVDPSGNVWVADNSAQLFRKFEADGTALTGSDVSTAAIGDGTICSMAFDSNGDIYAADGSAVPVQKVTAASGYTTVTAFGPTTSPLFGGGAQQVTVDRTTHRVVIAFNFALRELDPDGSLFRNFGQGEDTFLGQGGNPAPGGIAFDEGSDNLYVAYGQSPRRVLVYGPRVNLPTVQTNAPTAKTRTTMTVAGSINLDGGPEVTNCFVQFREANAFPTPAFKTAPCSPATPYTGPTQNITAELTGLKAQTSYTYRVVAQTANGLNAGLFMNASTENAVKAVTTLPATNVTLTSATLNGSLDPDGIATKYYFQYTQANNFTSGAQFFTPAKPGGDAGSGVGVVPLSANISIPPSGAGKTWRYRLVATNVQGETIGAQQTFVANQTPGISEDYAEKLNTDSATLRGVLAANGAVTEYHFEYGTEDCSVTTCTSTPSVTGYGIPNNLQTEPVSFLLTGLDPGQTYHFRLVAVNSRGTTTGADRVFKTYVPDPGVDTCPNSQARQQAGASLLLDCRSYELVSAANAGGFDVVSDLILGQEPIVASPRAGDRIVYSVDSGIVPGVAGSPTNLGRDPYVATRGQDGRWGTEYVGLPSDGMADPGAFGSPLLGSDRSLKSFAFGGPDICDPCFADGSTNLPLRLAGGSLVEGMIGPVLPAPGERNPSGSVAHYLSADGSHLVFGSVRPFAVGANNGTVSIYDRNLATGTTQLASTLTNGNSIPGDAGELDLSENGSRIVVGAPVSTDSAGNSYWHPYMHIGTSANTVDLAPTTTTGVIYAGMTTDGSRVFFTTKDALVGSDTDTSSDLYEAAVDGGGNLTLTRRSVGASPPVGNSNACNPTANSDGNNWNAVGGASADSCGVVAIAGGGGVAEEDGTVYFLSPEKLDGSGITDEPNLFLAEPGQSPVFVATLEPDNPVVRDGVADSEVHRYGDFQITPDGRYGAFNSTLDLGPVPSFGHSQIYRFDAIGPQLECASCPPTLASPTTDTSLNRFGLSLTDEGDVFFTTDEPMALRDTNGRKDAYQWNGEELRLISTGISTDDSSMLSVSADGRDAFFFTRETLVAEDANGSRVKLYVARKEGGSVHRPATPLCAASDECHGTGTQSPGPPDINTQTGSGSPESGNGDRCAALQTRAKRLAGEARRLRRKAKAAAGTPEAEGLTRRAADAATKARKARRQAKACRRSGGGGQG
jgi:hypothetical protein